EGAGRGQRVLHVGDSLVAGTGVAPADAFPAVLGRAQPGVAHVNAGIPGTGTDYQLLLLREWLARLRADVVVHYVFSNDVDELLAAARDEVAKHGARYVLAYLPDRGGLAANGPNGGREHDLRARVLATARALGVLSIDPWPFFEEAARPENADTLFRPQGDVHF